MTLGEPRAGGVAEIANMLAELTAAAQARRQASLPPPSKSVRRGWSPFPSLSCLQSRMN
jgi:hypothetical protein